MKVTFNLKILHQHDKWEKSKLNLENVDAKLFFGEFSLEKTIF